MSDGFRDITRDIKIKEMRETINCLEGEFLVTPNKALAKNVFNALKDYLRMKKDSDFWGQERAQMYLRYALDEISEEKLVEYIKEKKIKNLL